MSHQSVWPTENQKIESGQKLFERESAERVQYNHR